MTLSRRSLNLPPADRPYWHAPAGAGDALLYLAWGTRQFGIAPIAPAQHEGWVYAVVNAGAPVLVRAAGRERIPAGTLLLLGPDCAFGWEDVQRKSSRLDVWMWRECRHPALRRLPAGDFRRLDLDTGEQALLRRLHELTRREVLSLDAHSPAALRGLQDMLEAQIARRLAPGRPGAPMETVARALQWLEQHIDTRQPLARLADYLAVSPSTVQRIFREHLGQPVLQVAARIKMREAEKLIRENGISVKEAAYRLGYRHSHDFSRAFRRLRGQTPSTLRAARNQTAP